MLKVKQIDGLQAALDAKIAAALFDANTILAANGDNTPAALTVGASTIVGRAAAGNIAALTVAQVKTLLGAGAASGLATLDSNSKVVEDPANATATPTASKIPIANGSGKLAAGWGGAASTLATLNASSKVVEDPANATATPTASKIVIADGSGKVDGWVSAASDSVAGKVELATNAETLTGTDATRAVTPAGLKSVLDGFTAANDAMVFKGTVGTDGTIEIAALNSLATYSIGWTYKVITAGTIKGKVCEIGDMLVATVDRAGTGQLDTDWTVVQGNLDGAVIGPASVTADHIAVFDGTSGKLIKSGAKTIAQMQSVLTGRDNSVTGQTGTADTEISLTSFFSSTPSSAIKPVISINGVVMVPGSTNATTTKEIYEVSGTTLKIRLPYALETSDIIYGCFATE